MDIMIDMETMSSRNTAVIASIGAVAFDPAEIIAPGTIQPQHIFSVHLDIRQQEGRHFDGDTIYWWLQQSSEARAALRAPKGMQEASPRVALQTFTDWYFTVRGGRSWSFGATFDLVLLVDLYRWAGLKCPIHYRDMACARTMINHVSLPRPQISGLVAHGALDDAIVQTIWLQQSLQKLQCPKS